MATLDFFFTHNVPTWAIFSPKKFLKPTLCHWHLPFLFSPHCENLPPTKKKKRKERKNTG
jgi:hypothetical protein